MIKKVDLQMHSEALILIVKENKTEKLSFKEATIEEGVLGNKQVYLFWDYSKRIDFVGYRLYKDGNALNKKLISGSNYTDMDVNSGETHMYSVEVIYAYGSQYIDPISVEIQLVSLCLYGNVIIHTLSRLFWLAPRSLDFLRLFIICPSQK